MRLPRIDLSEWIRFENRGDFGTILDRTGVYVVGDFVRLPSGRANVLSRRVVYIGETTGASMSLRSRLRAFSRSSSTGRSGHSGGQTAFAVVPGLVERAGIAVWVPKGGNAVQQAAQIKYAERTLILRFATKFGRLPICNSE